MEKNSTIKLLIIAAHRHDRSPSQRFRFEQYFRFFEENGVEYKLSNIISEKDDRYFYAEGYFLRKLWILLKSYLKRWSDVIACKRYDAVFVQREAIMTRTTMFERLMAKRRPLIYDFDDAIWKMDVSEANQNLKWMKNPKKTARLIKHAALVIAGNNYLADYARQFNQNVWVIPTTVDTETFRPAPKQTEKIIIGWSGSKTTIKHFELAVPVLKKIKTRMGEKIGIRVIGEASYTNEALTITGMAWKAQTEVSDLNDFHIGIMPLPDDEWSKGKCGLKGLTYMALEIPTIMYAIGVNTEIIEHGVNGFLYRTDDELAELLERLVNDAALRERVGKEGRKTVEAKYSVKANAQNYLNAIRSVVR
ncbi:MAG TPA: glycosyltransferase family 4 protein [Flavobacteriales bacterium]|nr:glycosyltransferase family 4 protein [Flavobacteriales bacterium]